MVATYKPDFRVSRIRLSIPRYNPTITSIPAQRRHPYHPEFQPQGPTNQISWRCIQSLSSQTAAPPLSCSPQSKPTTSLVRQNVSTITEKLDKETHRNQPLIKSTQSAPLVDFFDRFNQPITAVCWTSKISRLPFPPGDHP